jgi:hypothetical protein
MPFGSLMQRRMTIRYLATHEIVGAHAASIARSCARLAVGRIRRTPSLVAVEYDRGLWSRFYRERTWERASSLEAFLVGNGQKPLTAWVDKRPCRISQRDYYRYRLTALAVLVESSLGDTEDLIELGSGYGYNLFALSLAFPNRRFIGLDISPAGVATGRAIAEHFGLQERIEFDLIDLVDPHHANYAKVSGRVVLTYFCLEQLPAEIGNILRNISRAGPNRVMHVEPAAELLSVWRPAHWANLLYVWSKHYQASLLGHLRQMRDEGKIELIRTERVSFAPTIQQIGLLASWAPCQCSVPLDEDPGVVPHHGTARD